MHQMAGDPLQFTEQNPFASNLDNQSTLVQNRPVVYNNQYEPKKTRERDVAPMAPDDDSVDEDDPETYVNTEEKKIELELERRIAKENP